MSFPKSSPTFDCQGSGSIRRRSTRSGLSIVEVLTSVVVAMIGVFGVMALIPFAVKQASIGLDSDAAVVAARNAISQIEITGMQFPQNWVLLDTSTSTARNYDPHGANDDAPGVFSLDPLGILEVANIEEGRDGRTTPLEAGDYTAASFPFRIDTTTEANIFPTQQHATTNGDAVEDLGFPAANLTDPGGVFNLELARRMCRTGNDLVFREPDTEDNFSGPVQVYDQDGGDLRRQSNGRISWSAIVVPFKPEGLTLTRPDTDRWSYRMYILVYKDRQFGDFQSAQDPGGAMRAVQLDPSENTGLQSPLSNVILQTGVDLTGIQRDDWVMLINRSRSWDEVADGDTPPVPYAEKGFDKQLAFYRIVNFAPEDTDSGTAAALTLDGPDFNFGDPNNVLEENTGRSAAESVVRETYIVHLKDVVGVYERTFNPEQESNWTFSN